MSEEYEGLTQEYLNTKGANLKVDCDCGFETYNAVRVLGGDEPIEKKTTTDPNRISEDFWYSEWDCKDGTRLTEEEKVRIKLLVDISLQPARYEINSEIEVESGKRTREYDESKGRKVDDSAHYEPHVMAADVSNTNLVKLGRILKAQYDAGIIGCVIFYKKSAFVHVDLRNIYDYKNNRYFTVNGFNTFEEWCRYWESKGRG